MTNLWENELVWTRERIRFTDNERTKEFERKKLLWMKEFQGKKERMRVGFAQTKEVLGRKENFERK